jgi:hypothetical protein
MLGWPWTKADLYVDDNGWRMRIMRVRISSERKQPINDRAGARYAQEDLDIVKWRHIGFSGTRQGMSADQKQSLEELLLKLKGDAEIAWFRHGDCIGADAQAHTIARRLNYRLLLHPPDKEEFRAFCDQDCFSVLPVLPYLERNKVIVKKSDFFLAAPAEFGEQITGGTWYSIRYARKLAVPMRIIYPDGSFSKGE